MTPTLDTRLALAQTHEKSTIPNHVRCYHIFLILQVSGTRSGGQGRQGRKRSAGNPWTGRVPGEDAPDLRRDVILTAWASAMNCWRPLTRLAPTLKLIGSILLHVGQGTGQ